MDSIIMEEMERALIALQSIPRTWGNSPIALRTALGGFAVMRPARSSWAREALQGRALAYQLWRSGVPLIGGSEYYGW